MNAIELLKADHKVVDGYFQQTEATEEDSEKKALFEKINTHLTVHAHIEEKIFYPRLLEEGDEELQDIVKEGLEEHRQVKMFLREIAALADESEKLDPKLKVLIEDTRHHVMEEEGEMSKWCKSSSTLRHSRNSVQRWSPKKCPLQNPVRPADSREQVSRTW